MNTIKNVKTVILMVASLCAIAMIFSAVFVLFAWVAGFLFIVVGLVLLLWAFGYPVKITVDGEVIGHYKRTKFIPKK